MVKSAVYDSRSREWKQLLYTFRNANLFEQQKKKCMIFLVILLALCLRKAGLQCIVLQSCMKKQHSKWALSENTIRNNFSAIPGNLKKLISLSFASLIPPFVVVYWKFKLKLSLNWQVKTGCNFNARLMYAMDYPADIKYRRPSLSTGLLFAVLTIRGRWNVYKIRYRETMYMNCTQIFTHISSDTTGVKEIFWTA